MPRFTYGGQALIEGVLMRGRDAIAVAFRAPSGTIVWAEERLDSGFHGSRWARLPGIRGLIVLYETLIVGSRWLVRSAALAASEEGVELGKGAVALMLVITLVAGVGVFFLLPLFIASIATSNVDNGLAQHLVEGLVRVLIFVGYLLVIGRAPDVQRVFQYHGAEHKTINAFEAGWPLEVASVRRASLLHPRCGTGFLVVVLVISVVLFSVVAVFHPNWFWLIASRVIGIPLIAGIGFELIRFMARHRYNPVVRVLLLPVLGTQKFTTRQPTDDMLEVAITAFNSARQGEEETAGAAA